MMTGVFQYSFAHAKTRALRGGLLKPEDWRLLSRCQSVAEVLRFLSGTPYAVAISRLPQGKSDVGLISLALYSDLFSDYAKLLKAVPAKSADLLTALLWRYDAENLKTVLRGIRQAEPGSGMRFLLYDMKRLSHLPMTALLRAQRIPEAIACVRATIFYTPLVHALPQFKARGRLFPLEMAVDTATFRHLAECVKALARRDRKGADDIIGELIDVENLCWLARFRHYYGLSPEEIINYILPGGRLLGIRRLAGLARSLDLASFLGALPLPYRNALASVTDWPEISPLCKRRFVIQLGKVFTQALFQIRLQMAYLLLKEMEIERLEGLLSILQMGLNMAAFPERLAELSSFPVRGGAHVQA